MPRSNSPKSLQGVSILLDPAAHVSPESFGEAVFRLIEDRRVQYAAKSFNDRSTLLDRMANLPLGDHKIEERHGKGSARTALKTCRELRGYWSYEVRCCLTQEPARRLESDDSPNRHEVRLWGLTKDAEWILVSVRFSHDHRCGPDEALEIQEVQVYRTETARHLAQELGLTPLQMLQRTRSFLLDYRRRLRWTMWEVVRRWQQVHHEDDLAVKLGEIVLQSDQPLWISNGGDDSPCESIL